MMGPDLLGRLIDEHGPALVLYARQWCSTAEDVVQEAFIKLVQVRPTPSDPVPWLYATVRNLGRMAARSARRRSAHEAQAASRRPGWFCPSEGTGLDAEAAAQALEHLPLDQREIIVAHLWGGLTFEQIAKVVGVSSSTAHRWYLAGLSALREKLRIPCPPRTIPN